MGRSADGVQPYALACWICTAIFAARVLGQAIQLALPQPYLPPAEAFQGSSLPYWALLAAQLAILSAMLVVAIRLHRGRLRPSRRAGVALASLGGVYMVVSLGRIAIGLAVPGAGAWFRTWIPALVHVALAAFVLIAAAFHLARATDPGNSP